MTFYTFLLIVTSRQGLEEGETEREGKGDGAGQIHSCDARAQVRLSPDPHLSAVRSFL